MCHRYCTICSNLKIGDWGFKWWTYWYILWFFHKMWLLLSFVGSHAWVLGTWWMSWPLGYHGQMRMSTCTKLTTMMHLANGSYGNLISLEKKQRPNIHSHIGHTWKILAYYSTSIHGAFNLWSKCQFFYYVCKYQFDFGLEDYHHDPLHWKSKKRGCIAKFLVEVVEISKCCKNCMVLHGTHSWGWHTNPWTLDPNSMSCRFLQAPCISKHLKEWLEERLDKGLITKQI